MAVLLTCQKCGESYCRNEGPQDLHVCKTLEQQAFEHEQEMERQFASIAKMDLQKYAADLEEEIERLKTALQEYGSHDGECQTNDYMTSNPKCICTCGYEKALKGEKSCPSAPNN